jgi:hypothetical protein
MYMREKDVLMEILPVQQVLQLSLEKRLEMLSERQRTYIQGYLDGVLQAYRPLKSNGTVHLNEENHSHEPKKGNRENEKK